MFGIVTRILAPLIAAYRRQFRVSRIAPPNVEDAIVTVKLERLYPSDLNDPVPLILAVKICRLRNFSKSHNSVRVQKEPSPRNLPPR